MREKAWWRAAKFHQIGIVVANLDAAIDELDAVLGIPRNDWMVVDQTETGFTYYETGEEVESRITGRYARAQTGGTVYQLIAVSGPKSVWSRALAAGRPVFALGHSVDSVAASLVELEATGAKRLAWGQVTEDGAMFDYAFVELPHSALVIEVMSPAIKSNEVKN